MFRLRAFRAAWFALPALVLALPSVAGAHTAGPPISISGRTAPGISPSFSPNATVAGGEYAVTYYSLSGSQGETTCVQFKLDSSVGLGRNGGTWYSNDFPYFGNWVVEGSNLRFYGEIIDSSSAPEAYVAHQAKITNRGVTSYGYDEFDPSLNVLSDGNFTMVLDAACSSPMTRGRNHPALAFGLGSPSAATSALPAIPDSPLAAPDATVAGGLYQVNTYPLNGSPSATNCFYFQKNTHIGLGHNGGTWYSTQFSNFGGNWVVKGNELRFYASLRNSSGGVVSYYTYSGKLTSNGVIGHGYDDFNPSLVNFSDGTMVMTLDPSCGDGAVTPGRQAAPR